jgi:hypothetical protein
VRSDGVATAFSIGLRLAETSDADFIVEMARHACVIEDWPLPDSDSAETTSLLPTGGALTVIAAASKGVRLGAVWTMHHDPPLLLDADGVALPEVAIAVISQRRGQVSAARCLTSWLRGASDATQR